MKVEKYVAFLRGINVGKKKVPMIELKKMCDELGFSQVRTVLNTGNIIFETRAQDIIHLRQRIERELEKTFGFRIDTIIRLHEELVSLVERNPFKTISMTPETRLYVTFLSEKSPSPLTLPYPTPERDFTILSETEQEVCSVLILSGNRGTTDAMKVLEKEFGKRITTRNWNTVAKIAAF